MKDNLSMLADYMDENNEQVVSRILTNITDVFEQFKIIIDEYRKQLENL